MVSNNQQTDRNAWLGDSYKWPNNKLYYQFDSSVSPDQRNFINIAVGLLQSELGQCIKFEHRSSGNRDLLARLYKVYCSDRMSVGKLFPLSLVGTLFPKSFLGALFPRSWLGILFPKSFKGIMYKKPYMEQSSQRLEEYPIKSCSFGPFYLT